MSLNILNMWKWMTDRRKISQGGYIYVLRKLLVMIRVMRIYVWC